MPRPELKKVSNFTQVEKIVASMYNLSNPKPGKHILLLLDVDDTLVDTSSRKLPATDPGLVDSIRRMLAAGVLIRILTARPNTPGNYIILAQNLSAIEMPQVTRLSQHAIMTGGAVDKGTALVNDGKSSLRTRTHVVFVDDVTSNLTDVGRALARINVGRYVGLQFVKNPTAK
jgi:hypothetical protein